jgi:S-adenosylmethionine-diacylgycerolhomoserine-N-methlytransferase
MDRMYRYQRHIYDLTRKYYLFGRDRLLDRLALEPGAALCEVGCGTARNLIRLARRDPSLELYGVDASAAMLATAAGAIRRAGVEGSIQLAVGTAESFDPRAAFGRDRPFDGVLFSYSLSMMPDWTTALTHALSLLRPNGGTLAVVDFGDLAGWPRTARALLMAWLALFDVHPSPAIGPWLARCAAAGEGELRRETIGGGYAQLLTFRRTA